LEKGEKKKGGEETLRTRRFLYGNSAENALILRKEKEERFPDLRIKKRL